MNLFWVPLMLILVFNPEHFYQNCLGIVREVGMESIGGRQLLNTIKKGRNEICKRGGNSDLSDSRYGDT